MVKYNRIVLKISGEALAGELASASSHRSLRRSQSKLKKCTNLGFKLPLFVAAATSGAAKQAPKWEWNVRRPITWACWQRS